MGFDEDVLAATRGYQDSIRQISDAFREKKAELEESNSRHDQRAELVEQVHGTMDGVRQDSVRLRSIARDIIKELADIERKRADLLQKQALNDNSIHELEDRVTEASVELSGAEKALRTADDKVQELTAEMAALTNERRLAIGKRNEAIRRALRSYCEQCEGQIRAIDESGERAASRAIVERYQRAVDIDPQVAALAQARSEWQGILAASKSEAVKKSAQAEITKVEKELEKRFPGILTAEKVGAGKEDIIEVYFMPQDGGFITFMPLTVESLRLSNKEDDVPARVLYEFSSGEVTAFADRHEMCVMLSEADPGDRVVTLELGGGSVGVLFAPVTQIVMEAIDSE